MMERNFHFTFRGKLLPYLVLGAFFIMLAVDLWKPSAIGFPAQILSALLFLMVLFIWKKYFTVLIGKPAFIIHEQGLWVELDKALVPWDQLSSVRLYTTPELLILEYPSKDDSFARKILPKSFFKPRRQWFLQKSDLQERLPNFAHALQQHFPVERLSEAPDSVLIELKRF